MTRHVPISEFKDHASELVAAVERGEEFVITRHGRPAAKVISVPQDEGDRRSRILAALEGLAKMRAKMRAEGRSVTVDEIIAWKNEGRP